MTTWIQELRFAARGLIRAPALSAVVIVTLALGIGANSVVFSIVDTVLLRPLPYPSSERLAKIWQKLPDQGLDQAPTSAPNFLTWREESEVFDRMAAFVPAVYSLVTDGPPEQVYGAEVSADLFELLGVEPWRGRPFVASEDDPGAERLAVISYSLWQRLFGARTGALGEVIKLDGSSFQVVGIMPPNFSFVDRAEIWTPLVFSPEDMHPGKMFLETVARLRPGATVAQARAEMASISAGLSEQLLGNRDALKSEVVPLSEALVGDVRRPLLILAAVVGFVLLVACANVANLLLARAAERRGEVALRAAIGASRGRIVRQVLTESLLLALVGGAAGLALAYGVTGWLQSHPSEIPRLDEIRIESRVVGFTLLISLATGGIFGLTPALQSAKPVLTMLLKSGTSNSTASRRHHRARHLLVSFEVATALVVLIGAGLMIRSFRQAQAVDPGFAVNDTLAMTLVEPDGRFSNDAQRLFFYRQVLEHIERLPPVRSAGIATTLPLAQGPRSGANFYPEGFDLRPDEVPPIGSVDGVSPGYFKTFGIGILAGRAFTEIDGEGGPPVAIVDELLAERFWPGEDPIGKTVDVPDRGVEPWEIVGVARQVKRFGIDATPQPQIYLPLPGNIRTWVSFAIRCEGEPLDVAPSVRSTLWSLDREQAIETLAPVRELLADAVAQRQFVTRIVGLFAALALALAVIGIHGVLSHSVSQRRREIGLRRALGARTHQVLGLIVGQGLGWTLLGLLVGLAAAFALMRLLSSVLFEVTATDPLTYGVISLLFLAVALVATLFPAWRATRVDPMAALRYE